MILIIVIGALIDCSWSSDPKVSYHRPKLCPNASEYLQVETSLSQELIGTDPIDIFFHVNGIMYVTTFNYNQNESVRSTNTLNNIQIINYNYSWPLSLFVTANDDIYVANSGCTHQVHVWKNRINVQQVTMNITSACYGLFVDTNNTVYCSIPDEHRVIKGLLNGNETLNYTAAAGNGSKGLATNMLNIPYGIFVDINFDLYVADCGNNRIQRFNKENLTGVSVVGNGAKQDVSLNCPTSVIRDFDGYLYILHAGSIIVASDSDGFSKTLHEQSLISMSPSLYPTIRKLNFDRHGNIFVYDWINISIYKLTLSKTGCSSFEPAPCADQSKMGPQCDTSNTYCSKTNPCLNNGKCNDTESNTPPYSCNCPMGFNGTDCELDERLCKPHKCLNNGSCSDNTSVADCKCAPGWEGTHCDRKIDNCTTKPCDNNGVCRQLLLNYSCECLGDSYYGRHCELTSKKTVLLQTVSKSFAYVAIIAMTLVATFIITLDILKYCFGIDPASDELNKIQRQNQEKKPTPMIQRLVYANTPSPMVAKSISSDEKTSAKSS
ncbi:unnamed protein product [Rotaria magnacalcarata]|uniref:EGF-like domain-containing protein n=4 Tax=Rotaria magnacalcarata TaxID=392030 RepID=A0A819KC21_9BILA|nr:unnamed protein product [Rotaria magnacalcarata]CAF2116342.1 unnamed protein product [Rotaria magnacalcarata]CAF3942004.1 unnamed protein product [Rotaria magnacalcarata]CAF3978926.1 unnamed protein product [Rotaria magnacalcarata]